MKKISSVEIFACQFDCSSIVMVASFANIIVVVLRWISLWWRSPTIADIIVVFVKIKKHSMKILGCRVVCACKVSFEENLFKEI